MAQAFARITLKAYQQISIQGLVPNYGCTWTGAKHLLRCVIYYEEEHGTELEAD
jgi:hypothetical protein